MRNSLLAIAAKGWSQSDPGQVYDWLRVIPSAAERDAVLDPFIRELGLTRSSEAIQWLEHVSDEGKKRELKAAVETLAAAAAPGSSSSRKRD